MSRPQRPESSDPRDIAIFMDSRFDEHKAEILQHIDAKFEEQRRLFLSAFPASDPTRHRLWHEDRSESEADNRDMRRSVTKWATIGLMGSAVSFNWDAIKEALKALWK